MDVPARITQGNVFDRLDIREQESLCERAQRLYQYDAMTSSVLRKEVGTSSTLARLFNNGADLGLGIESNICYDSPTNSEAVLASVGSPARSHLSTKSACKTSPSFRRTCQIDKLVGRLRIRYHRERDFFEHKLSQCVQVHSLDTKTSNTSFSFLKDTTALLSAKRALMTRSKLEDAIQQLTPVRDMIVLTDFLDDLEEKSRSNGSISVKLFIEVMQNSHKLNGVKNEPGTVHVSLSNEFWKHQTSPVKASCRDSNVDDTRAKLFSQSNIFRDESERPKRYLSKESSTCVPELLGQMHRIHTGSSSGGRQVMGALRSEGKADDVQVGEVLNRPPSPEKKGRKLPPRVDDIVGWSQIAYASVDNKLRCGLPDGAGSASVVDITRTHREEERRVNPNPMTRTHREEQRRVAQRMQMMEGSAVAAAMRMDTAQ